MILENAMLQRELNNPLKDAQGLAALLAISNDEQQLKEGGRQFDAGLGQKRAEFDRQQNWTERFGTAEGQLKERELQQQGEYYRTRGANESRQIDVAARENAIRRELGLAGIANQNREMDQRSQVGMLDMFTKLFEMNNMAKQSGQSPMINPDDLSSILVELFDRQGVKSYELPTQRNAATLEGLLDHYNKTGERPNPETLEMIRALSEQQKQQQQPAKPAAITRKPDYIDNSGF